MTLENAIEHIDIGGLMLALLQNNDFVTVVVDPDYGRVLDEMRSNDGATTRDTRQQRF